MQRLIPVRVEKVFGKITPRPLTLYFDVLRCSNSIIILADWYMNGIKPEYLWTILDWIYWIRNGRMKCRR